MIRAEKISDVREQVSKIKSAGKTIGLVPTMGFLHEGHGSLIKKARSENDYVIVSDFVNPIQFGPKEDLAQYPRDFEADCALCESLGVDLIFHPDPSEMYSDSFSTTVSVSGITEGLCGKTRPGHFAGVCTVCSKLFNISSADRAYFGQKDAQQLAVIRRMVRDMNMNLTIVSCPIIREEDGLAKSSRNTYLDADEREAALVLSKSLFEARDAISDGNVDAKAITEGIRSTIESEPLARIDYIEAVSWDALEPVTRIEGPTLIAIAVYIADKVRLIDNIIIE